MMRNVSIEHLGGKVLAERHRRMLEVESAIHPSVIEARGYWTAETEADFDGVPGIKPNQMRAPALVLPVYGVGGEYLFSRVRPDEPLPGQGKYLQPAGTPCVLDVPRPVLEKVTETLDTLAVVEGERKGDYLASLGIPVVVLFGCWNWGQKTNEGAPLETKLLLRDFDAIRLRGRPVSIMFDCDIRTNTDVQRAAYELAMKLKDRGAQLWA